MINKHEKQFKKFLEVEERISELRKLIANQPFEKYDKKIFAGHWRFFKVREDILRSSIGSQVKMIVDACNCWVLGSKNNPKSYMTRNYLTGEYVESQKLRTLSSKKYAELNFPDFFQKKWFHPEKTFFNVGTKNIEIINYTPNIPDYMLEYQYKPAYKIEGRVKNGSLESELKKLQDYMEKNQGWSKIYGRNDFYDLEDKKKLMEKIKYKDFKNQLIEY